MKLQYLFSSSEWISGLLWWFGVELQFANQEVLKFLDFYGSQLFGLYVVWILFDVQVFSFCFVWFGWCCCKSPLFSCSAHYSRLVMYILTATTVVWRLGLLGGMVCWCGWGNYGLLLCWLAKRLWWLLVWGLFAAIKHACGLFWFTSFRKGQGIAINFCSLLVAN